MNDIFEFYCTPAPLTQLPEWIDPAQLPGDIPTLVKLAQNLLVHIFWAQRYGLHLSEVRKSEVNLRSVRAKFDRLQQLADQPVNKKRNLDQKLVGNCRDFSLLLTSFLRAKGIPARARCGFSTYFTPKKYEDHWVVEYWHMEEQRWVMVDAQLDELQIRTLKIRFNPLDVPSYQFVNGGKAWLLCRAGQADPDAFGIFEMHGLWFVRGDLVRDILALNKQEILPWDVTGLIAKHDNQITEADFSLLDHMAGLCLDPSNSFTEIRALADSSDEIRIPPGWLH